MQLILHQLAGVNIKGSKLGSKSETTKRGKKAKPATGKLSLYPLSVEDALRAAARTGRVTTAKSKEPNQGRKKSATPT
jgi:hypothetical protein